MDIGICKGRPEFQPSVRAEQLVKHYRISAGPFSGGETGGESGGWGGPGHLQRRNRGAGGGKRLRKIHAGKTHAAVGGTDYRHGILRRSGYLWTERQGDARPEGRNADHLPGSLFLAQPPQDHRLADRRTVEGSRRREQTGDTRKGAGHHERGGTASLHGSIAIPTSSAEASASASESPGLWR